MRPWSFDLGFLAYYLTNWSLVIGMWVVASALVARWRMHEELADATRHGAAPAPSPVTDLHGFLLRLPAAIGRDVVALQVEDHYIRVHTQLGNALVLGSLSDAMGDLERSGIAGQRTHRSWWVANHAVTAHAQRGRQLVLELNNGVEVPVSVTYRQMAAASGLLAI